MDTSGGDENWREDCEIKLVNEMVKAFLILDVSKKPFKQSDVVGFLNKSYKRKMWDKLFPKAKDKLKELGLSVIDINTPLPQSFIITSNLYPFNDMHKFATEQETADRVLLILVLTYIFMNQKPMKDVDILKHLEFLQIYSEEKPIHDYFGDIKKKLFTDFVQQLYFEKVEDTNLDIFSLKWGKRANAEVSKRSILNFVCKVGYDGTIQPQNFVSHYKDILREENDEAMEEEEEEEEEEQEQEEEDDDENDKSEVNSSQRSSQRSQRSKSNAKKRKKSIR